MKLSTGDMVSWYSMNEQDTGIVIKRNRHENRSYIFWFSGDSHGWFDDGHPSIGVVSYASR